ncbi:putative Tetratricopeptide repeat protein [Azospirillaceae bacterium]
MATLQEALTLAFDYYETRHWIEAETLCRRIVEAAPDHPTAHHLLGLIAAQDKRWIEAERALRESARLQPNLFDVHAHLGHVLKNIGSISEAIVCWKHAIQLRPNHAESWFRLAENLLAQDDVPAAIDAYQNALNLHPDHGPILNDLALALMKQKRYEIAVIYLERAADVFASMAASEKASARALYNAALCHDALGERISAIHCLERAVAHQPCFVEAWANLGAFRLAGKDEEGAIIAFQQALYLNPDHIISLLNLGRLQKKRGALIEAEICFRRVLACQPSAIDVHIHLATILEDLKQFAESAIHYRVVLQTESDDECRTEKKRAATAGLGRVLALLNQPEEAWRVWSLLMEPPFMGTTAFDAAERTEHHNFAIRLRDMGRPDLAIACLERLTTFPPEIGLFLFTLGDVYATTNQPQKARKAWERAVQIDPQLAAAHYNLGNLHMAEGRWDKADVCYRRAADANPDLADAWFNLGVTLDYRVQDTAAIEAYRQAIAIQPDHASAHYNLGLALLRLGAFVEGWREHEWRWRTMDKVPSIVGWPQWRGEFQPKATLLVYAEQGHGDGIQFIRYIPLAAARVGRVIVECPRSLMSLFLTVEGVSAVQSIGTTRPPPLVASDSETAPPEFDVQCTLMSLPAIFGTTLETIPAGIPYLRGDQTVSERWRQNLERDSFGKMRIGLVWAGNSQLKIDYMRSLSLKFLFPLFDVPNIHVFCLQVGDGRRDLMGVTMPYNFTDIGKELEVVNDFFETASVISELDLVISSCTAPAHLAGALGVPTWVMLAHNADWRWLTDRDDSPWYPTMRLFRQSVSGDWDGVVRAMIAVLSTSGQALRKNKRNNPTSEALDFAIDSQQNSKKNRMKK